MSMSADDFLFGGAPSLSWADAVPGTTLGGEIVRPPTTKQQTDFDSGKPLFWEDGSPRMQLLVQLKTPLRDASDPLDDGTRTLYVKGSSLTNAVRAAVKSAGARSLAVGGQLFVTFTGLGPKEGKRQPPRLFSARYVPPAGDSGSVLGVIDEPAPAGIDPRLWAGLDAEGRARTRALVRAPQTEEPPF